MDGRSQKLIKVALFHRNFTVTPEYSQHNHPSSGNLCIEAIRPSNENRQCIAYLARFYNRLLVMGYLHERILPERQAGNSKKKVTEYADTLYRSESGISSRKRVKQRKNELLPRNRGSAVKKGKQANVYTTNTSLRMMIATPGTHNGY